MWCPLVQGICESKLKTTSWREGRKMKRGKDGGRARQNDRHLAGRSSIVKCQRHINNRSNAYDK